ncbi:MAG: FadR family transcriptional regulator [Sphingomonadales bacterium]|nr:FadR family transcriptional regulator [Sphingomonadales bacterium]
MQQDENMGGDRLYQSLARELIAELKAGKYAVGTRMPAERELALAYGVSRPTVREAIISLEVQGLVEVRIGSGTYIMRLPHQEDNPGFATSAIEIAEARLLFEGEAAALAAIQISDAELLELENLLEAIGLENCDPSGTDKADREFHQVIAGATRNTAVQDCVSRLWDMRAQSPESALLHAKARAANVRPVVDEHAAVLSALRNRDPNAARTAMRAHITAALDGLLFATEEQAVEEARQAVQAKRERTARAIA